MQVQHISNTIGSKSASSGIPEWEIPQIFGNFSVFEQMGIPQIPLGFMIIYVQFLCTLYHFLRYIFINSCHYSRMLHGCLQSVF